VKLGGNSHRQREHVEYRYISIAALSQLIQQEKVPPTDIMKGGLLRNQHPPLRKPTIEKSLQRKMRWHCPRTTHFFVIITADLQSASRAVLVKTDCRSGYKLSGRSGAKAQCWTWRTAIKVRPSGMCDIHLFHKSETTIRVEKRAVFFHSRRCMES